MTRNDFRTPTPVVDPVGLDAVGERPLDHLRGRHPVERGEGQRDWLPPTSDADDVVDRQPAPR